MMRSPARTARHQRNGRRRLRLPACLLGLCLAAGLLALAAAAAPAHATPTATTGDISGRVTDASGGTVAGIDVYAYDASGILVDSATTGSQGSYDLDGLATGSYRVEFWDSTGTYAFQYYNDKSTLDSADGVSVSADETTPNIDASLALGGHITGTVTDTSGSGLENIDVVVYDASGSQIAVAITASDGSYDFGGLATGSYRLEFEATPYSGDYATVYYDGEPSLDLADGVAVTAGQTTSSIDVVLVTTSMVSGDTTPPTTSVAGVPAGWVDHAVTLTFSAVDNAGGSGMVGGQAKTEYKIDAGAWTRGTSCQVSGNGAHSVSYRSCDAAGNWETAQTLSFHVDTLGPRTAARAASGRKGRRITLYYRIYDNLSPRAKAVVLKVRNRHHKVVKSFRLHTRSTGLRHHVRWTPRSRGTYRYSVYARDLAGNHQRKVGTARVVVR